MFRNAGLIGELTPPMLEVAGLEKEGLKFVWKMLNGSFDLLGIKLKGEDSVVCCCWLSGIPRIVGMKG